MTFELKRVDSLRAANLVAVIYGVLMAAFALLFLPLLLFMMIAGGGTAEPLFMGVFLFVFYPVMGVVFGWLSTFLACAVFNFIVRWTGGLLLEFAALDVEVEGGAS